MSRNGTLCLLSRVMRYLSVYVSGTGYPPSAILCIVMSTNASPLSNLRDSMALEICFFVIVVHGTCVELVLLLLDVLGLLTHPLHLAFTPALS